MVNPDNTENRPVSDLGLPDDGMTVHMKKYRFIPVFHTVNKNGKNRFWTSNFLTLDHQDRKNLQAVCWSIEHYHRALKDLCCVENRKITKEAGQRNHVNCSKSAVADYVAHPKFAL